VKLYFDIKDIAYLEAIKKQAEQRNVIREHSEPWKSLIINWEFSFTRLAVKWKAFLKKNRFPPKLPESELLLGDTERRSGVYTKRYMRYRVWSQRKSKHRQLCKC
jgi:hypothetical protein